MTSRFDEMYATDLQTELNVIELNAKKYLKSRFIYKNPRKTIYIAAPWFDEKADLLLNTVENILTMCPNKLMYDFVFPKNNNVDKSPKEVYDDNVNNIVKCDGMIALISRKDVGTAYEIGLANAYKKPLCLVGFDESCFNSKTNVMLAFSSDCCIELKNLVKYVTNNLAVEDVIQITDEWEGKE